MDAGKPNLIEIALFLKTLYTSLSFSTFSISIHSSIDRKITSAQPNQLDN